MLYFYIDLINVTKLKQVSFLNINSFNKQYKFMRMIYLICTANSVASRVSGKVFKTLV